MLLLIVGIWWLLLVAEITGGDAIPACEMLLVAAVTYVLARALTRRHASLVPMVVVAAAILFAYFRQRVLFIRGPDAPLGYSNATGSLYMLAAAAALMVVARARTRDMRIASACAAVAFAAVPLLNTTATATVLVAVVPLALLATSEQGVRVAVATSAAAFVLTLAVALSLGLSYRPIQRGGRPSPVVDATLSERRLMLWSDALRMISNHPLTGVGPDRFPETSPTALRDPDTPWPHDEVLHFGAEAGLPGAAFLLLFFGWGFARLWWSEGDRGTAVAAAALGAVAVHSNVDYVLHYPAVVIAAAALVGAGSVRGAVAHRDTHHPGARTRRGTSDASRAPGREPRT